MDPPIAHTTSDEGRICTLDPPLSAGGPSARKKKSFLVQGASFILALAPAASPLEVLHPAFFGNVSVRERRHATYGMNALLVCSHFQEDKPHSLI